MTLRRLSLQTLGGVFAVVLLMGCDSAPSVAPPATSTPPLAVIPAPTPSSTTPQPFSVTPAPAEAGFPEGTVIITSEASKTATAEQRKAVVDRLFAPANATTASTGMSPADALAVCKKEGKKRYPKADPKFIDEAIDAQHEQLVRLSRRSDGTFVTDYYTKKMYERLDDIMSRYPPK